MNNLSTKPLVSALAAMLVFGGAAQASGGAGKDEAVAMVKQAVAFIKDQGPDKAYPEITDKASKFHDRDLYVVVYQLDGKVLAHGSNAKFSRSLGDFSGSDRPNYSVGSRPFKTLPTL